MGWFGEEPGGLNRVYAGLLGNFAQSGAAVHGVVAGSADSSQSTPAGLSFFASREAPTFARLRACRRSVQQLMRDGPMDVAAAHFALYALPVLDFLRKQPFVFHFHGPWANESKAEHEGSVHVAAKRMIESFVYGRADRFIVLSAAFASILERDFGVDRHRIFVVPGGVDTKRYGVGVSRRDARERLGLPTDRPLILSVRRLIHRVGLEHLIDAIAEVRRNQPDALLLIAGTGALEAQFRERIAAQELSQHVRLLGRIPEDDLPLLYRACDLSVMPSVALEGFGLPAVESLAAGTPVLVTPVGGLPEIVGELDPALIVPEVGTQALAEALGRALRGLGTLPSAECCARYAQGRFDWPIIARQVLAVYAR